jgi:hypothetical protein
MGRVFEYREYLKEVWRERGEERERDAHDSSLYSIMI